MYFVTKILRTPNAPTVQVPLLCAWCLSEQGKPAGEGSHGICKKHADKMLVQCKQRKGGRTHAIS